MNVNVHTVDGTVTEVRNVRARDLAAWSAGGTTKQDLKAIPFEDVTAIHYLGAPVSLFARQGVN
jgi:hypothetical protein